VNGQAITSASNGDVTINPDGTGDISIGADIIPDADATHTIGDENNRFITLHSELNGAVQFKARNETGGPLTKGQAVYISGVSGSVPLVSLARANSASTMPAHGLLAADVSNNADVQVVTFGNLTDYNTTTYSLSANDTVYVSSATAGALTNSAPTGEANLIQNIGRVVRADASAGIIKVGGAGRSAATPNLDSGKIFLGDGSNQAVSTALSAINLTSFNDDLGSTYQPLDAGLTSIAGLTTSANQMLYTTGSDAYDVTSITAAGRAILDDADATAQRTTLGLGSAATEDVGTGANNVVQLDGSSRLPAVDGSQLTNLPSGASDLNGLSDVTISTPAGGNLLENNGSGQFVNVAKSTINVGDFNDDSTYQPLDTGLTSIAGLTTSANQMLYTTGSDTYDVTSLTAAGRAILDDADAAAQRTTLGLVIGTDVLANVVEDTTPQLGGNLDTNGRDIVTTSNADLDLAPDGTGVVVVRGNQTGGNNQGAIKLNCEQNTHGVTIKSPAHASAATYTLTLPVNDGDPDQVLKTDGSGVLSWVDQASGGGGFTYSAITADPSPAVKDTHYSCTGTFTITLPAVSGTTAGDQIRVKNIGTGTVTIDGASSETVDGSTTFAMDVQWSAVTLVSNGSTGWEIV
jgi:predicted aspartyl protease